MPIRMHVLCQRGTKHNEKGQSISSLKTIVTSIRRDSWHAETPGFILVSMSIVSGPSGRPKGTGTFRTDERAAEPRTPNLNSVIHHPGMRLSETVLIVEDEPALRNLMVHALKSKGYTVLSADNPTSALDLVLQYKGSIDLLLADVVIPGRPGPELASEIKNLRPGLKVLYMSGYSRSAIEEGVLEKDATLIVKPFSMRALHTKMRAILES